MILHVQVGPQLLQAGPSGTSSFLINHCVTHALFKIRLC